MNLPNLIRAGRFPASLQNGPRPPALYAGDIQRVIENLNSTQG